MSLRSKTVLVTGAGGFIGSHLAERLVREGAQVRAMIHYGARSERSDLPVIKIDLRVQHESEAIDDRFGASRRLARVA